MRTRKPRLGWTTECFEYHPHPHLTHSLHWRQMITIVLFLFFFICVPSFYFFFLYGTNGWTFKLCGHLILSVLHLSAHGLLKALIRLLPVTGVCLHSNFCEFSYTLQTFILIKGSNLLQNLSITGWFKIIEL